MRRKIKLIGKAIWQEFAEWAITLLILAVFGAGVFAVFAVCAQFCHWVGGFMSAEFKNGLLTVLVVAFGLLVFGMLVYEIVTAIQCRYHRLAAAEDAEVGRERHGGIFGQMYKEYGTVENHVENTVISGDYVGGNKNV